VNILGKCVSFFPLIHTLIAVTELSSSFLEQGVGIKMKSKRFRSLMEPSGIYESDDVSADDESSSTKPSAE
jgi:hypothetical protein